MIETKTVEPGNSLAAQAGPMIDRAAGKASAMAHRGLDAVLDGTDQLRAKAQHASDSTVDYIRQEPVKAWCNHSSPTGQVPLCATQGRWVCSTRLNVPIGFMPTGPAGSGPGSRPARLPRPVRSTRSRRC